MEHVRHGGGTPRRLGLLAGVALIAACSEATNHPSEKTGYVEETLLSAPCVVNTVAKTVAFQIADGEVAYVGKVAGCTVEPCVFVNALNAGGAICRFDTAGYAIDAAYAAGSAFDRQKLVLDYTNGLFSVATSSTPPTTISLRDHSTVMVVAPATGGNMALGVNGLDINTLATRTTAYVDVTINIVGGSSGTFLFNGGVGKDVFTGDAAGWPTAPTGWDTTAHIAGVVGVASTLDITANGGAGDDTLGGGGWGSTLIGGPGNDTFLQSSTSREDFMTGGDGIDTVDYSVRTAPVTVTVGVKGGINALNAFVGGTGYTVGDSLTLPGWKVVPFRMQVDAVDGSGTITSTSVLTWNGSGYPATGTAVPLLGGTGTGATQSYTGAFWDDGEVGEWDDVGADIEIVRGGSGNDILSAYAVLTTDVVLIGNGGNDKLTGGGGQDDLCGGAGDDTFYENPGSDYIVGGLGQDTLDYSGATALVTACLNAADTLAGKPCATTNGQVGEKDVVNATLAKVCPRATLTAGIGIGTGVVAVPATMQGAAMAVDVENLTGHASAVNHLYCGTLACTVFGGSGDDVFGGGAAQDLIIGMGGGDNVTTNGGSDVVDLTHGGGAQVQTVDCSGNQVTILISAADFAGKSLNNCLLANLP
jgi:Ca2+-binding RTX toxin-like protein